MNTYHDFDKKELLMPHTVGSYLLDRLKQLGVGHIFGIPGDFVLGFNKMIEDTPDIEFINTCDEQGAGFAADAYARLNGLGVVCITYCVGGLKVANAVAGAYAEKSPVIVISGAPGMTEREKNPLLHHKVKDFDTQKKIFDELTVAATVIRDPKTAKAEIDRVIQAALDQKRPVYIELPRDMVFQVLPSDQYIPQEEQPGAVSAAFSEALNEAVTMISAAKRPAILADVEIHRFGLQEKVLSLAEHLNIPIAATVLGKSVIAETHPLYMGVYAGGLGNTEVREYIESSDCLIMLGVFMTDMNLGVFTANLDPSRAIYLTSDTLSIKHHHYDDISMPQFLEGLMTAAIVAKVMGEIPSPAACMPFVADAAEITVLRLFAAINSSLTPDMVVVADVGDATAETCVIFKRRNAELLGYCV
jgi:TPP-dependent 2-oxoacid decarboxylase